jgi:hypothetical protein
VCRDFVAKLYTVTKLGTTVIIADNKSSPVNTTKPGLLFSGMTTQAIPMPAGFAWTAEKAPTGPVSIIVSTADRAGYVYPNGVKVGGLERLSGTHIYAALATVDAGGKRNWISTASVRGWAPNFPDLANKLIIAPEFLSNARASSLRARHSFSRRRRSAIAPRALLDSTSSRKLLDGMFHGQPNEEVKLKGLDQPVLTYWINK